MKDSTLTSPLTQREGTARTESWIASAPGAGNDQAHDLAASLISRIFQHLPFRFEVSLWTGSPVQVGASGAPLDSRFTLHFRNPRAVSRMILGRDALRLAEAFFNSDLDINGDLFAALRLRDHLEGLNLPISQRLSAWLTAHKLSGIKMDGETRENGSKAAKVQVLKHSKDESRSAIRFHYDVSNDFYRVWLDRAMVYSCAYFEEHSYSLEAAQQAKLEHICRKLSLRPGERLLDIGCGWGALVLHAARHYGVRAHGITLSEKQLEVARRRIVEEGLKELVTVELKDYRDLEGNETFDKVASVGMFEHVGVEKLPRYFDIVHRLLKTNGLFLNHGIAHTRPNWDKTLSTQFINRYVFPDGQLDRISNIQRYMEEAQFNITDVEALGAHYAMTLRRWVSRLERHKARALEFVSEATYRVWRLYMAACALEFESGQINVYQVLAVKSGPLLTGQPLTRRHWYRRPATAPGV